MACYLVISSRHLSNGHYRGIKGVFRGPLCKKGSGSPAAATSSLPPSVAPRTDYAEKEKAAAKALEDVKANFYCELCDKQYHKHHEFDNHINSYDHAHKQRLKDLKQREFARNVASKSWKDEKKQEKALKRLHQLAELRKQSECISRSGPLLKAPRLVVEKQQSSDGILLCKGGKVPASSQRSSKREGQGFSSSVPGKQQLIISRHQSPAEIAHRPGGHISQVFPHSTNTSPRAGVSFSFSKKVPLKLESSASLFSENSEEGTDCSECLSQKAKQALEGCRSGTLLEEEVTASLDRGPPIMQNPMDLENSAPSHGAANPKVQKDSDKEEAEDKVSAQPSFSKAKTQLSNVDFSGLLQEAGQESSLQESEQLPAALPSAPHPDSTLCPQPSSFRHSSAHLPGQLPEFLQQPAPELACGRSSSDGTGVVQRQRPAESSKPGSGNVEALPREAEEVKPQALPFLQVVSKDGSTALQWPTELLLFTKTEPCISYGCNPLYFDFRLSVHPRDGKQQEAHKALNPRDGKQQEAHKASCKGHPQTADENLASGLMTHKQTSNKADRHLSKPKKMKGSLNPRRAKQKAVSDVGKEGAENGQKCIPECLNENPPKVPAHLAVSHNNDVAEKGLQTTALRSPSKHLVHNCEGSKQSIRNESISFSAFIARVKKSKAARCPLLYSEEKHGHQNDCRALPAVASCSSDISDSSKDSGGSFLSSKSSSSSRCSETEGCGNSKRCWRCPSPPKSSCERHSCSPDSSVSSTRSYLSYVSPASHQHSRDHPLVCCKSLSKRAGRHRCRHRKHRCGVPSADTGEAWLCPSRSHRSRKWAQGGTVKYRRCSRHNVLQHRDRSKHSRCGHQHLSKGHSRSYQSSRSYSTRDSRSSERSSSRISRRSSSRSFSKEADNSDNQTKEDTERGSNTKLGEEETAQDGHGNGQSKALATCSSETLAEDVCGRRKSLTAQLLLDRVQAKKSQEQMCPSERFPNACGVGLKGHSRSHFALPFAPPVGDIAALPLPKELLSMAAGDRRHQDTSMKKGSAEAPELRNAALSPGTDCDHCLLQDIIQIGAGCQSPRRSTAIQDPPHLFFSEVQPFLEGCEPVPNDFPGAFPSSRYSVVAHSIETKEELAAVSMGPSRAEASSAPACGHAVQQCGDTACDLEGYSKPTSPPLTQRPVTFSPEEVDKYRLLQLQAQQHMQKQLLAKQLKVLPSPGPAPAAPALPVQQQATITTIHHTLLQRFAVSAALHPHGSHLSLAHLHPLSQAHFAPVSLSPLSPALLSSHPALLAGHPLHLVSSSPLHAAPLLLPTLPHAAYIPALFTPHLSAATASALHPAPLAQPLLQSQEHHHHSFSSQTQHLPSVKEVFSVSSYLT